MEEKISNQTKVKAGFMVTLLKILEVGGVLGLTIGLYYLGKLAVHIKFITSSSTNSFILWWFGLLLLGLIVIIAFFCWLVGWIIWIIIKANWRWALMLVETPREKIIREKKEREKKKEKLEKKKSEYIDEHGFWIGDKVKVNTSLYDTEEEKFYKKTFIVEDIKWTGAKLKGHKRTFSEGELDPIHDRRDD